MIWDAKEVRQPRWLVEPSISCRTDITDQENEFNSVTLDTVSLNERIKWFFISRRSWHLVFYIFQLQGNAWRSTELLKTNWGNRFIVSSGGSCWNLSPFPNFYLPESLTDAARFAWSYWVMSVQTDQCQQLQSPGSSHYILRISRLFSFVHNM